MTPEQAKLEEEKLLSRSYICQKCQALVMTEENMEGKQCCPVPCGYYCDGILRKMTSKDIDDMAGTSCTK